MRRLPPPGAAVQDITSQSMKCPREPDPCPPHGGAEHSVWTRRSLKQRSRQEADNLAGIRMAIC